MKRLSSVILLVIITGLFTFSLSAAPDPVARDLNMDLIIEPVDLVASDSQIVISQDLPEDFNIFSLFEHTAWYQKLLLWLPFLTATIFVLDKFVKFIPGKYDDILLVIFKAIVAALKAGQTAARKRKFSHG